MKTYEEVCGEVFQKLSGINVNDHTEKKGNLTYLSWAWAYQTMMDNFPTFTYKFDGYHTFPDDTVEVRYTTKIVLAEHIIKRTMWLPVMNYRNQAIQNPSSMEINTAKMRCFTKCISQHGLGLYIYAGEDIPQEPQKETQKTATPKKKVVKKVAKKKVTKKEVKKAEPEDTHFSVGDAEFQIDDQECAEFTVDVMKQLVVELHSDSMENLISFWQQNGKIIDFLSDNYPAEYARLKDAFSEIKNNLLGVK
jgi:hypothetical protein